MGRRGEEGWGGDILDSRNHWEGQLVVSVLVSSRRVEKKHASHDSRIRAWGEEEMGVRAGRGLIYRVVRYDIRSSEYPRSHLCIISLSHR